MDAVVAVKQVGWTVNPPINLHIYLSDRLSGFLTCCSWHLCDHGVHSGGGAQNS